MKQEELSPPASHGFWTSDSTAGCTHVIASPRPLTNRNRSGDVPNSPPRHSDVLSLFSPPSLPPSPVGKGFAQGMHSGTGSGAAPLGGGYQLLSSYWHDPKLLWSSMLWHPLPPQQDPSTPMVRISSLAARHRITVNPSHPFHILL